MTLCVDPDISSHVRARTCEFTLIARFRSRNIISSFAWISQFTALAVSDCAKMGNQKAAISCGERHPRPSQTRDGPISRGPEEGARKARDKEGIVLQG